MKVRDLLQEIEDCEKEYGAEFLDWDVYTEQLGESDKLFKHNTIESNGRKWDILRDDEDWEYYACAGFWTKFPKEKAFTINVNY